MNSRALSPLLGQQGRFKRSQKTLLTRDSLSMELVTVRWGLKPRMKEESQYPRGIRKSGMGVKFEFA
jgi:hypothetical protein